MSRPASVPSIRLEKPERWPALVASIHPLECKEGWICLDADIHVRKTPEHPEGVRSPLPVTGHCPECLAHASLCCSRCGSVYYCGKECQKKQWRYCHKKACQPCPNKFYKINTSLDLFRGLPEDCFQGHDFITIKPTEKLSDLAAICEQALEGADDICDIPGFGCNQISQLWAPENQHQPVSKRIRERFGWTSGAYGVELVHGYRTAEDIMFYTVLCDDSFLMPASSPGLAKSYYGGACFGLDPGKECRGNLVIFKQIARKKKWRRQEQQGLAALILQLSDDSNLQFEYELYPISKAEVAHMLSERRKAMEQGAFTRRMWRSRIRKAERQIELSKPTSTPTIALG